MIDPTVVISCAVGCALYNGLKGILIGIVQAWRISAPVSTGSMQRTEEEKRMYGK